MNWLEVDKEGLARVLARREPYFVLHELVANCWDAPDVSRVDIQLQREGTRVTIEVQDDSPNGFTRLSDAYTMFSKSERGADETRAGRFGFGEKLVLALMKRATISSTSGTLIFDAEGRRKTRQRRERGSSFRGELAITSAQFEACCAAMHRLLVPAGIVTTFNGEVLPTRAALATVTETLPTDIAEADGHLRPTKRKATVQIYAAREGESAYIYELGIPIVEMDGRYSVNVGIKVPLSLERDGVRPAYLARIRAIVLETMTERLTQQDATSTWVRDALEAHGDELPPATVNRIMDLRFTDKRVTFDASDLEANKRAVAAGYTLVHGSQMSAAEWSAARSANAILPAGQVTPSPRPDSPDGAPRQYLEREKWSRAMTEVAAMTERVCSRVVERAVTVRICSDVTWPFGATYGDGHFTYNLGRLGHRFFEGPIEAIFDLMVHECGHQYESDHLSTQYYHALTKVAGRMVRLALKEPTLFAMARDGSQRARDSRPAAAAEA